MLDLDRFKRVNDRYGHLAGDLVLRETGRRLSGMLRTCDTIGRYGGEEFLVVIPGVDQMELCELGERLRAHIEYEPIMVEQDSIPITLSIGLALAFAGEASTESIIQIADAALYKAKRAGRNRAIFGVRQSDEWIPSHIRI